MFHILITSWQLREAICHVSLENVAPITHEQNNHNKTRLDESTHKKTIIVGIVRPAVICRSRGGLSANGKEEKNATNDDVIY